MYHHSQRVEGVGTLLSDGDCRSVLSVDSEFFRYEFNT